MDENIFELDGKTFNLENSKERTDLENSATDAGN